MITNFEIVEKDVDDIKVLEISGELDALVAPQLKEKLSKLISNDTTKFVINMNGVIHINSLAMGILRGKLRSVHELGGDMKLAGVNPHIMEIFEMIGLDELFDIYEKEEDAIASYKK